MQAVRWSEEVVDNEFMNKKKSVSLSFCKSWSATASRLTVICSAECCIFHKQKSFGDWSDDDSDDECKDCNKAIGNDKPDDKQDSAPS